MAMPELRDRINTVLTEYAGHAEVLAYELSKASERPLIIASGGDGSYHEVVNGAMRAIDETRGSAAPARPVCGLLPGGNANDHHRALHSPDMPIEDMIVGGRAHIIDLLRVETSGRPHRRSRHTVWPRYAHSYCGFGLTAEAGHELNQHKLNRLMEVWLVMKTFRRLRPKRVFVNGRKRAYTSLVCSNIHHMSKFLKLSDSSKPHDGKFEITAVRGRSKRRLIMSMFLASTRGFPEVTQTDSFTFTTIRPMRLQIDGEIYRIAADTEVRISVAPQALRCVV
jgi:diacylglycerol kinase family enzyme